MNFPPSEKEQSVRLDPIKHIGYDFISLTDEPRVVKAFGKYLREELELNEAQADELYEMWQQKGRFACSEMFEDEPAVAIESYRLTIYQEVLPRFREAHSSQEFLRWLPTALEVIVPAAGRHQADVCLRVNGVIDGTCEMGECPIKQIVDDIVTSMTKIDYTSFDYIIDHEKVYRDLHGLLDVVSARGFIDDIEKHQLKKCYEYIYNEAFPVASE